MVWPSADNHARWGVERIFLVVPSNDLIKDYYLEHGEHENKVKGFGVKLAIANPCWTISSTLHEGGGEEPDLGGVWTVRGIQALSPRHDLWYFHAGHTRVIKRHSAVMSLNLDLVLQLSCPKSLQTFAVGPCSGLPSWVCLNSITLETAFAPLYSFQTDQWRRLLFSIPKFEFQGGEAGDFPWR